MARLNLSASRGSVDSQSNPIASRLILVVVIAVGLQGLPNEASGLETVNLALTNRNFQMALYPIAQERGYMQEEGIDLRPVLVRSELSIQAMIAGSFQFSMAGTMGLVSLAKGGAPLKVILATNDKVLSWIISKPELKSLKDLKGKRIAVSGVTSATTIMAKQVLAKHGLEVDRDLSLINTGGTGNSIRALMARSVDAIVASAGERYAGRPHGFRELVFVGDEVKNSWGTMATTDQLIQEKPKLVAGIVKASLKALRFIHKQREATIATAMKFAGLDKNLATQMYDELVGTFTQNGIVDEETQLNDIEIIRQITKTTEPIPIQRAYDFRFAREADRQLTQSGWRP
jgi:ABC-type nitrate/sulfonate/bicarbonate transport system substrate-binding protein